MSWIKAAFLTGVLGSMMVNVDARIAWPPIGAGEGVVSAAIEYISRISICPGPTYRRPAGSRLEGTHQFEGRRDCETDILIREGNTSSVIPGIQIAPRRGRAEIPAVESFRNTGREHCLGSGVPRRLAPAGRCRAPLLRAPAYHVEHGEAGDQAVDE